LSLDIKPLRACFWQKGQTAEFFQAYKPFLPAAPCKAEKNSIRASLPVTD